MPTVAVARHAMATRFEILLHGASQPALQAAGEEALDEITRLEAQLSLYRPTSEIAHVNSGAANKPVRVSANVFQLLQHALVLHAETKGAFDITVAPLVRCWGFMGGTGQMPEPAELAEARKKTGTSLVELNEKDSTVRFKLPGVMIDLGAIGKGYALDRAAALLREAGVESALLNGGTSTVYGLGHPPEGEAWKVALEMPPEAGLKAGRKHLATVSLCDQSLSVSAVWGRAFQADGKTFGHVLDPRTGNPVAERLLSAVVLPSATETDALSTALLVGGESTFRELNATRPSIGLLLIEGTLEDVEQFRVNSQGIILVC